jgi:hypothetical protein
MANEQFVREHWSEPWLADSHDGKHYGIVLATASLAVWSKDRSGWAEFGTPEQAWSAAAAFTRERLEQIRQVEQEVGKVDYEQNEAFMLIRDVPPKWVHPEMIVMWVRSLCATSRILAREQAALTELKKGMR